VAATRVEEDDRDFPIHRATSVDWHGSSLRHF